MRQNVIWKSIPGYEGYYEASTEGDIRSLDRYVNNRNSFVAGRIMRQSIGASGYLQVSLTKEGKVRSYKVHRLVAMTFIGNPDNKPCLDNINTIRTDNRVSNLRWVTHKENSCNPLSKIHSKYGKEKFLGSRNNPCPRFNNNAPNSPKAVYRYDLEGAYIDSFRSLLDACLSTGIEATGIKKALDKTFKQAGGYLWKTEKAQFCESYKRRRHTKCKVVEMLGKDMNIAKSWPSVRDAAKELGTTHTRIIKHIKNKLPIDGFYFRYSQKVAK